MVSILVVFTLACSEPGPVVQRRRRIRRQLPAEVKRKPSTAPVTATTRQEDTKQRRVEAAQEQQPATAAQDKQENAKRGSAATQKLLRELIAIVEKSKAVATKDEEAAEDAVMLEITGLIMEETMTKIGYDFYE